MAVVMPASLHIPKNDKGLPVLKHGEGVVVDGVYGRENCRSLIDQKEINHTAWMHTVMICISLWGGFWFQFVIQVLYDIPSLYVISDGVWFYPTLDYYLSPEAGLPFSLAEKFVGLSLFGSLLAIVGGWHFTIGAQGKRRMMLVIMGFAYLLSAWSIAGWQAEAGAWEGLEFRRQKLEETLERPIFMEGGRSYYRQQLQHVEELLLEKPEPK